MLLGVPRLYACVYIGEMWDLDAPAAGCASAGRYDCFLTAEPLTIIDAIGSPLDPPATK
ncbi:hypothetical protein GCM10010182_77290 [Actinomadura cremea]|nr:hypothetical protein GCM10010182_77290 [Actinomadura cremea]